MSRLEQVDPEIAKAIRERVRVAPPIAAVEDLSGFVAKCVRQRG